MKYSLVLFFFLPLLSLAQGVTSEEKRYYGTSVILKDQKVLFRKSYKSELAKDSLLKEIKKVLTTVSSFKLVESTDTNTLIGMLSTYKVQHPKKENYAFGGISNVFNFPLAANIQVYVQEGAYRVTVSDMVFNTAGGECPIEVGMVLHRQNVMRESDSVKEAAIYLDKDLTRTFELKVK